MLLAVFERGGEVDIEDAPEDFFEQSNETLDGKIPAAGLFFSRLIPSLALIVTCLYPSLSIAQEFRILTEEFPPYNFTQGGKVSGISSEIVRELLKRTGHPDNIEVLPWSEGYGLAQTEDNVILFSTTRTPARENLFKWVGPLVPNNTVFFAKKGSGISIASMDDARKVKSIGVYKDDFGELLLKEKGFTNLDAVVDNKKNVKKLAEGKIDLWIINELTGKHMAGEQGLGGKIENVYNVQKDFMYMAFSKSTPDATIEKWQKALDDIKSDGTYAQIFSDWVMLSYSHKKSEIGLTAEEQSWIANNPTPKVGNEMDWAPFDYAENGQPKGYSIDMIRLVGKKAGIEFKFINGFTWNELLEQFKSGEIDILPAIMDMPERRSFTHFTSHYLATPLVIVMRTGAKDVDDIKGLKGKKVAVVKDYYYEASIRKTYPEVDVVPVSGFLEGLELTADGKVDAFIGSRAVVLYTLKANFLTGLDIIGRAGIKGVSQFKLRFGVRKDLKILHSILEKGLDAVTIKEKDAISSKWIPVEPPQAEPEISYLEGVGLFVGIAITIFLVLTLAIGLMVKFVKEESLAREFGSIRFRIIMIIALSFMIALVAVLDWITLRQSKEDILSSVRSDLEATLTATTQNLEVWVEERKSILMQLGRDKELAAIVKRLLDSPTDPESLKTSPVQKEIRAYFSEREAVYGRIGFFIINPDMISVGSMRDANLGTRNLIDIKMSKRLARAFAGEAVFIPPIRSDVAIKETRKETVGETPLTMFFAAPVRDGDGNILAVLTQRVLPEGRISTVVRNSRFGSSGESYIFDIEGHLVTESRFTGQLFKIGLLDKSKPDSRNIEIRDPGGNLLDGYRPQTERAYQPFTRMASSAIAQGYKARKGESIPGQEAITVDTTGYRDYRGVPVYGAWKWDQLLGSGVATEIDMDEALAGYYSLRRNILTLTGVALLLSVAAILFTLIVGERANRSISRARDELEKRVENRTVELKEREQRLFDLYDNSPVAYASIKPETGEYLKHNMEFARLLEFERDDLALLTFQDIFDDGQEGWERAAHYLELAKEGEKISDMEARLVSARGEPLWGSLSLSPHAGENGLSEIRISIFDITERKRAQAAMQEAKSEAEEQSAKLQEVNLELNESDEIFQSITSTALSAIIMIDNDGNVKFWNKAAQDIFGWTAEEITGKELHKLIVPPHLYGDHIKAYSNFQKTGRGPLIGKTVELVSIRKDGEEFPAEVSFSSVNLKGKWCAIGLVNDISERKSVEEEIKKNLEELERFNTISTGREERMIELKEEINELRTQLGKEEKYKTAF